MAFGKKIAEAFVVIRGDKGRFSKTIKGAKLEMSGFAKSATKNLKTIAVGLVAIGVAAAAAAAIIAVKLTRAIIGAGVEAIKTAASYDKLFRGLSAVSGGAANATRQFIRLRKVAELPGLSFRAAIEGSINLQAAEVSASLAERSLKAFGNALVTVGRGVPELQRVNLQLTQLVTKSSGFGQELRILRETVPQIGPLLRRAFNNKPIEELSISGKELLETMIIELEKLPTAAGGVANDIENIGISFELLKGEIGRTMLAATSTTLQTLTKIIESITKIIPVWKLYQDDVSEVFQRVARIAVDLTGKMLKSMLRIVSAVAPLIFKPLEKAAKARFRDIAAGLNIITNELLRKTGLISQTTFERFLVDIINANQEANNKAAKNFEEEFDKAFKNAAKIGIEEFATIPKALSGSLEEILAALDSITSQIPEKIAEPAKEAAKTLNNIGKGVKLESLATAFSDISKQLQAFADKDISDSVNKTVAALEELEESLKKIKKEAPALDSIVQVFADLSAANAEFFGKAAQDSADKTIAALNRLLAARKAAARESKKLAKLEARRLVEMRSDFNDFTSDFRSSFTNMFADLLGGRTKSLWTRFWTDMANIATRKLAEIAVDEAFDQLFSLVQGLRGQGTTAAANQQVTPPPPVIAPPALGAPSQMAPGVNVIFPNADIEHMSPARVERAIQRQFTPARRRLQRRGVIAQTM